MKSVTIIFPLRFTSMSLADTMAMVLLALRCIITDHRHRHLQHFIRRPALGLAGLQGPRGSFGSLRSTALAMQALQDLQLDSASAYNRSAASKWILDRQRTDGGWTEEPLQDGQDPSIGVGLTADVILALGCKGLGELMKLFVSRRNQNNLSSLFPGAIRALQCDHVVREANGNGENGENGVEKIAQPFGLPSTSAEDTEQKNVSYSYTLWLESNITEMYSLQLVSPKNTSFFKAMTQAADQDSRYLRHLLIQLPKRLTNFALQILIRGSRMAQRALHTHARWQKGRTDVVSVS